MPTTITFPYNVAAVRSICPNISEATAESGVIYMESSWTDTPSLYMTSNNPEVGAPIRRLRSKNVKHTMPISFTISNYWYNLLWMRFIALLHGGVDRFYFPEITYNRQALGGASDINLVEAWLQIDTNGNPFSVKRQDNYTYIVSATVCWIDEGALND